jgi:UDP-N-acetylmuramoylalanine--D-glutamate ligase
VINWRDKRVLLVGFGDEGRAMLQYLSSLSREHRPHAVSIADQTPEIALSSDEKAHISASHLGPEWLATATQYDIIVRSPGVPLHTLAPVLTQAPHIQVTSSTNLFMAAQAHKTIAVTATKGKSTTASLLHHTLVAAGINAKLGGNIGIAAISLLNTPADLFVLELSSYQLEDCRYSPHGAVFLNLYPEHLDHHIDFARYGQAKAAITEHQNESDFLVIPHSSQIVRQLTSSSRAQKIYFGDPNETAWIENDHYHYRTQHGAIQKLFHVSETRLKGPGNQQNILAVLSTLSRYDIPAETLTRAITGFKPLPHRLEEVATIAGVTYINDSISTVPEAAINALETFGHAVKTVILGGYDRGISFENLARYLVTSAVKTIILFPPSGARIEQALLAAAHTSGREFDLVCVESMREAVQVAKRCTPPDSVCLLSPASPSFPIFKNFQERGERFRQELASA